MEVTRIFWPYTNAYWESSQLLLKLLHLFDELSHALVPMCMTLPGASLYIVSRKARKDAVCKLPAERTCKFSFVNRKALQDLVILYKTHKRERLAMQQRELL